MSKNSTLLTASIGLGAIALILQLMNDLGVSRDLGIRLLISGILALVLATAAFFIAVRKPSVLLSGFLVVQGTSAVTAAALAGAMIGVPFGVWVLALGITKAAITVKSRKVPKLDQKKPSSKVAGFSSIFTIAAVIVFIAAVAVGALYFATLSF